MRFVYIVASYLSEMGAQRFGNPVVSVSNIKYISGFEVFEILKNRKMNFKFSFFENWTKLSTKKKIYFTKIFSY
jgi:hypothetical protein